MAGPEGFWEAIKRRRRFTGGEPVTEVALNLYVLWDVLAEESGPVFECANDAVAVRSARQILVKHNLSPADVELRRVGVIDHKSKDSSLLAEPNTVLIAL